MDIKTTLLSKLCEASICIETEPEKTASIIEDVGKIIQGLNIEENMGGDNDCTK